MFVKRQVILGTMNDAAREFETLLIAFDGWMGVKMRHITTKEPFCVLHSVNIHHLVDMSTQMHRKPLFDPMKEI